MREVGRRAGLFGEPAGVAGFAGLRAARATGVIGAKQSALVVLTGSGLKDTKSAIRAAGAPCDLPHDDEALDEHLRAHRL
jgi:threonine synthase